MSVWKGGIFVKEKSKVKEIDRQMAIKGHTISSLAKATGLSKLTVREVLCCERFPSAKTSKQIAKERRLPFAQGGRDCAIEPAGAA